MVNVMPQSLPGPIDLRASPSASRFTSWKLGLDDASHFDVATFDPNEVSQALAQLR